MSLIKFSHDLKWVSVSKLLGPGDQSLPHCLVPGQHNYLLEPQVDSENGAILLGELQAGVPEKDCDKRWGETQRWQVDTRCWLTSKSVSQRQLRSSCSRFPTRGSCHGLGGSLWLHLEVRLADQRRSSSGSKRSIEPQKGNWSPIRRRGSHRAIVLILVQVQVLVIGVGSDEHTATKATWWRIFGMEIDLKEKTLSTQGVCQHPLRRRSDREIQKEPEAKWERERVYFSLTKANKRQRIKNMLVWFLFKNCDYCQIFIK